MTIMHAKDVIPKYFRDLSHNPRKEHITTLDLNTGTVAFLFFSECCSKETAGVAQQFLTQGVCSFVDGPGVEGNGYVQILSKLDCKTLRGLQVVFARNKERADCAAFEERTEAMINYAAASAEAARKAAELYNARLSIEIWSLDTAVTGGGFHLFPEPPVKDTLIQKLKKKLKKKGKK